MAVPARTSQARIDRAMAAHYALPGLLGSALIALGALGVGWLPANSPLIDVGIVNTLRSTTAGEALSRIAVFAGVALLLQTWLVLGHDVLDDLERDDRRLVVILAIWVAPLLLMPPLFSRDAYSYFAQGQLVLAGLNPYENGVSALPGWFLTGADPLWAESPTPYGPAFLILQQGVAAVAGTHAFFGALLFRLIALTGVALMVVYLPRLAHAHGIDPPKAVWLALLNPLVLMHFVAGAHNDALMVGLMVAGLTLAVERHPVIGILLIGLAGAVKPIALVVLPFAGLLWAGTRASWPQRIWAWVRASAIVLAVFAVLSVAVGVGLGWVASLSTPGTVRTWLSPPTAIGMVVGSILDWIGLGTVDGAVSFFRAVAMVAGAAIALYLVLRPEGRSPVRGAALVLLTIVALGPVVQPWYLLWALPLLAATGLTGTQLRAVMIVSTILVLHGMVESNATADTLVDFFRDGLAAVFALAMVGVVLVSSPGERRLLVGDPVDRGIRPRSSEARLRAGTLVVQPTGSSIS